MLTTAPIEVVAFDATHVELAAVAFARFGKKRHPADLDFGDCQSYAIARREGCPLLFKGNDFRKTDLPFVA